MVSQYMLILLIQRWECFVFFCSLLLQEDSTQHVLSVVFVCARVLTLRPREVMFVVVPQRASAPVLRTRSATAIKLQVLRFVLKFCASGFMCPPPCVFFYPVPLPRFGWGSA